MNKLLKIIERLLKEASLYLDLIKTNKHEIRISIELSDTGEAATLILGEKIEVVNGSIKSFVKAS